MAGLSTATNRRALRAGVGESVEHERILRLTGWRTVVDVGANRGQFALAAHRHNPEAVIYAFEPLAAPAKVFKRILGNVPQVKLYHCAVGPAAEKREMHVSARDDSSSLLKIGAGQVSVFPGTGPVAQEVVTVQPLQAVLASCELLRPALLKLDVQGFELDALKGCEALLSAFDAIYVECSFEELYEGQSMFGDIAVWLHNHEFDLKDIGPLHRVSGRVIQGDFLFRRN